MKLSRKASALLAAFGLVSLLSGCGEAESQQGQSMQRPPQQVDVVTLKQQDVTFKQIFPARSVAFREAEVRPQVSGIIVKRIFEEGAMVKAGDPLYQIDDTIYQANYQSALAEVDRAKANLQTAKADLKRYSRLKKDKAVSQQQLDQADAAYRSAKADLGIQEAALHRAKVNIQYTKVLAPISGRISKSNVTEGALVTAQQSQALATITQLDPIYFDLPMADSDLRTLQQRLASGELKAVKSTAQVIFSNGQTYNHVGVLKFNEVQTNPNTDSVSLRVEFPNPDFSLLPGMYARVRLTQAERPDSILIPQKAVQFNHDGSAYVMMTDSDNKVVRRTVTVDRAFGQDWLITSGAKSGDKVIVEGLQKIGPGMTVQPHEVVSGKAG